MYSTQNEGKSVIAQRFIKTLKNRIYKHVTAVSQNMYSDKLGEIVENTYHSIIEMKPAHINHDR